MISVGIKDQLIAYHKAFSWMFDRVSFGSMPHPMPEPLFWTNQITAGEILHDVFLSL
jgi:hypothetical protein